jgi:alanyl-tRNA synthetase
MPGKIPTDSQRKIIDNIFRYHLTLGNNSLNLSDYSQEILTQLLTVNLYQALKTDQQRIDKILTQENIDYFEFLKASLDKTVVDEPTLAACRISVEVLRANQDIRTLLQLDKDEDDKTIEVFNELFIKAEPSEQTFGYHGMLDNVVIDHNTKTIFINDLKTLGKSIQDFPDSVEYYRYWIQAII